jgi:lysophospholipase L1-like esterase
MSKSILVFGGSAVWGQGDLNGGWVHLLRKFIDTKYSKSKMAYKIQLYNLGVSGETTTKLAKWIDYEIEHRIKKDLIVVICLTTNDSARIKSENSHKTVEEKFVMNINLITKIAQKYTDKVVVVNSQPVSEHLTNPLAWSKDKYIKNKDIEKYNSLAKRFCSENNIDYIDIYKVLKTKFNKELSNDGVHPNTKGHQLIFAMVRDFLIQKKLL